MRRRKQGAGSRREMNGFLRGVGKGGAGVRDDELRVRGRRGDGEMAGSRVAAPAWVPAVEARGRVMRGGGW